MTMKKVKRTTHEYISPKGEHETSIVTVEEWSEPVNTGGSINYQFAPPMPYFGDQISPFKVTSGSILSEGSVGSLGGPNMKITTGTIPVDGITFDGGLKIGLGEIGDIMGELEKILGKDFFKNGGLK